MSKKRLLDLPKELLSCIFIYLSTFDIENVVMTCKLIYKILNTKHFGLKFLKLQQQYLTADVVIEEQISQLHTFAISLLKDTRILVILNSRIETKVIHIDISLAGRPCTWETLSNLKCNLLEMSRLRHRFDRCPFCLHFGITKYEQLVDKQYRVFFRNWQDYFQVKNDANVAFNVIIRHQAGAIDWDPVPVIPVVETSRYGIRIRPFDYCFLENLFMMEKLTIEASSDPTSMSIQSVQVYNPWA